MKKGILIVLLTIFFVSLQASARDKGKGRPHGWSKGEKKGWNTDVPPGLEKKGLSAPQDLSEDGQGKEEDMTQKKKWKKKKDSDAAEENGEEADEDDDDDEEDKEEKDQKLKQKKGKGNEQKKRGRTQKGE